MYENHLGWYEIPPGTKYGSWAFNYWRRALFMRLQSVFEFSGLPKSWNMDAFKFMLFTRGNLAVFNSKSYGIVAQPCTLGGIGLMYEPTYAVVATPYFSIGEMQIGKQCEIIKLCPDYHGLCDIVTYYATQLSEVDTSIRVLEKNSKVALLAAAKNKQAAQTLKEIMEKVSEGETSIFYDKAIINDGKSVRDSSPFIQLDKDLKSNFVLPELMNAREQLLEEFDKEVGITSVRQKAERKTNLEIEAENRDTGSRIELCYETVKRSFDTVNKRYNINMKVEVRYKGETSDCKLENDL